MPYNENMVQDLYVLMITAAVASIVFKFLKQPVVLGYIVAGVLSAHFVAILVICGAMLTSCTVSEDNPTGEQLFEQEMTAALADARIYGPQTEAFAQEVATLFNGYVTDINYKTRESATRKCKTDNSRPYDLKDLARTTIIAGWDSIEIKPVIDHLNTTATERGSLDATSTRPATTATGATSST